MMVNLLCIRFDPSHLAVCWCMLPSLYLPFALFPSLIIRIPFSLFYAVTFFFLAYTSELKHSELALFAWLLSLNMACLIPSILPQMKIFNFLNALAYGVYLLYFVCSSVDRHFGESHVLATTDRAAINLGVQRSLRLTDFLSLGYKTSTGTAESHSGLFLVPGRTPHTGCHSDCTNLHSHQQPIPAALSLPLQAFVIFVVVDY